MDDKSNEILSQPLNPEVQSQEPPQAPEPAPEPTEVKKPNRLKKYILIGAIAAFLIIIGVAIFLWIRTNNTKGVEIQVELPETTIQAGVPFSVIVNVENKSNVDLSQPQLNITIPAGLEFTDKTTGTTLANINLENIPSKESKKQEIKLLALSSEDAIRQIKVILSYVPGNISSRFEKEITTDIVVIEDAINLDVIVPNQVLSGQPYQTVLSYTNSTNQIFKDAELKLSYPEGFNFTGASQEPTQVLAGGIYIWALDALKPSDTGEITIDGAYTGLENSAFDVTTVLSSNINTNKYAIATKVAPIRIAQSPLALSISIDKLTNPVIEPAQTLNYILTYKNNTDIGLKDVIVTATVSGEIYDLTTLKSDGFLQGSKTIIWNAARVPELVNIPPGASGEVGFSIRTKTSYPITTANPKNYSAKIVAQIESPTVPRFISSDSTMGFAQITNPVKGQIELATKAYYKEPSSSIVNSGPLPPRVGSPTQYTVHWQIKNFATDTANVQLKAFLGPNVRFTGKAQSTTGVLPTYNARTQEMTWDIIKIPAAKGVLNEPVEAIFQVELTPSISQTDQSPALIEKTTITATDTYTDSTLTDSTKEVTIKLPHDPTIEAGQGRVVN